MNNAATKPETSIRSVAHEVWQQHPNNYSEAKKTLEQIIRTNNKLSAEAFRIAADHLIGMEASKTRKNTIRPIVNPDNTVGLYAMAARTAQALMDIPLGRFNGKRLGDATKGEVLQEAKMFKQLSVTHGVTAKFMQGVAQKVEAGKTVAQSMTERQLKTIRDAL